jgi:hypothetical protein
MALTTDYWIQSISCREFWLSYEIQYKVTIPQALGRCANLMGVTSLRKHERQRRL